MNRIAYVIGAAVAFVVTGIAHAYSYFGQLSDAWLACIYLFSIFLCVPIGTAYFRVHRSERFQDAWKPFWSAATALCPMWIKAAFMIAWILGVVALARTVVTGVLRLAEFHTAWCMGVSAAALMFAVSSLRGPKHEKQTA